MRRAILTLALVATGGCTPIDIGNQGFARRPDGAPGVTFTTTSYVLRDYPDSPTWIHGAPIVTGDFNHDGTVDLVVTITKTLTFVAGKGNGLLEPQPAVDVDGFGVIEAADVDEDGNLDLVGIQNIEYVGEWIAYMRGRGDGSFEPVTQLSDGIHAAGDVVFVDVNGDGHGDLVYTRARVITDAAHKSSDPDHGVGVRLGDGRGGFAAEQIFDAGDPNRWQLVAADFDHDGRVDIALGSPGTTGLPAVMFGKGDGTFEASRTIGSERCLGLATGDLNGDGNPDLVFDSCGVIGAVTLLNNGDGSFHAGPSTPAAPSALNVYLADIDGDERPDVIIPGGELQLMYGVGDGQFTRGWSQPSDYGFRSAAVADLNGDGRLDVLVTHPSSVTLDVYLNMRDDASTATNAR